MPTKAGRKPAPKRKAAARASLARRAARKWWLAGAALIAGAIVAVLAGFVGHVPLPAETPEPQSSKLLAADGQVIAVFHGEQNRILVPLSSVSPLLRKAVIAAEDRDFYHHPGVSLKGIIRAFFTNIRGGTVIQGGSTITQQYARNAFVQVGRQRTFIRKLKEATLAVKLERRYSKDKILEFYLNTVYFGRGAYGAEAAARTYFGRPASDLDLSQSAFLAGIIRSPELFRTEESQVRIRDTVLTDMARSGDISGDQVQAAKKEPLAFSADKAETGQSSRAAFFVEYIRRQLKDQFKLTDADILSGGLEVRTTLDLRMQDAAERAIAATLDRDTDPEAALVAIDPQGSIKAMVGGRKFTDLARARGFNFAWQKSGPTGGRQAGSSFKPFTLASFVEQGYSIDSRFNGPASLEITSQACRSKDQSTWVVKNFEDEAFGPIPVTQATAQSVNTVYAQMIDILTPKTVASEIQKVGGWTPQEIPAVCSLALGTPSVTPLEMARAFATFASRGSRPDILAVTKITSREGKVIASRSPSRDQVLDRNVADTVNQILQEVLVSGTAKGKGIGRPAAGKTGTTENYVDAWFVGYTPNLVSAVWMGFPPDTSGKIPQMTGVHGRKVTGGSFPATIWQKFMTEAVKGLPSASFNHPQTGGVLTGASPTPCPSPGSGQPSDFCTTPSPAPSPSPAPTQPASPSPPPPSPTPSKPPSPSPSAPPNPIPTVSLPPVPTPKVP